MLSQPLAPALGLGALCLMPLCEAASINSLQKTSASVAFCAEKAHAQPSKLSKCLGIQTL